MLECLQPNSEYAILIDNYALSISRPSLRYHFLRAAISEYQRPLKFSTIFGFIPGVRRFLYHLYIAKALYKTNKSTKYLNQNYMPFILKSLWFYYKIRFVLPLILLLLLGALLYPRFKSAYFKKERVDDALLIEMLEKQVIMEDKEAEIVKTLESEESEEVLPIAKQKPQLQELMDLSLGNTIISDTIWMVESKEEYELYSNGLRILREYETETGPRCFLIFKKDDERLPNPDRIYHDPIGIVYHTTESDIQPFDQEHNKNILRATRNLLKYIRRIKCYNYVIDRFGRVYRIIKDMNYAYHAGESVWTSGDEVYVNLNHSFIGVSFEGRSTLAGTMNEPSITTMQIVSARRLNNMLRQRYTIEDRNCVVHGLISVNSKNKIIGYHLDWAQDFPFELLGISDKYHVPSPSIVEFGFGYSTNMLNNLGGNAWKGVYLAENKLKERAKKEKMRLGELTSRLQSKFDEMADYQKSMRSKQMQADSTVKKF